MFAYDSKSVMYEHLRSRGMVPEYYQLTLDDEERVVTFYLFDATGKVTGYQQYRPDCTIKKQNDPKEARYYTYTPKGVDAILGLESLQYDFGHPLFIVEGVFKAANLRRLGFDAIAVLTSDPKRMRPLFRILRQTRPLIGIGDNDSAGQKLVNRVGRGACSPVDLDEMQDKEILDFVKGLK